MTCGELWIKANVNHLLFYPLSSRQCSLVALRTCRDFPFYSLSHLSSCLSSITLFTYTTPHANCIPQVTVAHTPSQFLTHPLKLFLFFHFIPFDSSQDPHLIYLSLSSITTCLSVTLYSSFSSFLLLTLLPKTCEN